MPDDNGSVTPATQEIRIATTMTGGVSLAIWMGGVARELNLLSQASRMRFALKAGQDLPPVAGATSETDRVRLLYLRLIQLLDVTVDVDVLSGTSAGGINAALLAYSRVEGKDLGGLRDMWLDIGALLSLIRNPSDPNVPSLLLGDAVMLAELDKAIPKLADAPADAQPDPDALTTLFVTTTLLTGETSRFTDSYGTLVQDVDHHGLFRFTEDQLIEANASALALAARSSASFPGAFEPSFVPFTTPTPAAGPIPERPAMAEFSDITRSHFVSDGGVLDNQPIGPLLQTVFDRAADRLVRRVLLYVVPSAGKAPDPLKPQPGDDVSKPYGLLEGLLRDIGAIKNQSIAADLKAIREHNDRVAVRTDARLQLATVATRLRDHSETLLTGGLLADYVARQADAIAHPVTTAMMRQLTTWPAPQHAPASTSTIPPAWQEALSPGRGSDQACRDKVVEVLATRWKQAVPANCTQLAVFDRPGFDGGKAVALSVFRAAYPLAVNSDLRTRLSACIKAVHQAFQPPRRPSLRQLVSGWCTEQDLRELPLDAAAARMAERYLDLLAGTQPQVPAGDPALRGEAEARNELAAAWTKLGEVFTADTTRNLLSELAGSDADGAAGSVADGQLEARHELAIYRDYLHTDNADAIAARLFALFAAQRAMLPVDADVEQPVELIQVSADTRTSLDPRRSTAASKLTGEQMHHFGAFFKQSWRANDWMWGRLDGAGWLVHLLLDPRRLRAVASSQDGSKIDWFLGELQKLGVTSPPTGQPGVRDELAFLDDGAMKAPVSLPRTAMWLAREWQLHIVADEVPTIAKTITSPNNNGTQSRPSDEYKSAAELAWADSVSEAKRANQLFDKAEGLLRSDPVPGETLSGEVGSPLMIRTVAKAAATSAAAAHSIRQIPAVVRPTTSWARTVSLAGYRLTTKIKPVPRWLIIVGLGVLAVGVLAAIQQSSLFGFGGLILAGIGAYLIVFGAWQMSRLALGALVSTTVVLAVGSLTLPAVRRALFGTSIKDTGWLGRQVHWIGTSPWHPLIILGAAALVGCLIALVASRRPPPRRNE